MSFMCKKSSTEDMYYKDFFFFFLQEKSERVGKKCTKSAEKLKPTRRCLALPSAFRSLPDSIKSTQRRGSAHMQALETGRGRVVAGEGGGVKKKRAESREQGGGGGETVGMDPGSARVQKGRV